MCCEAKDLESHDFGCYLVCYQNLTTYIWLAKSVTFFFGLIFACQILGMTNFSCKSRRPFFQQDAVSGANSLGPHEVRVSPAVQLVLQLVEDPGVAAKASVTL